MEKPLIEQLALAYRRAAKAGENMNSHFDAKPGRLPEEKEKDKVVRRIAEEHMNQRLRKARDLLATVNKERTKQNLKPLTLEELIATIRAN